MGISTPVPTWSKDATLDTVQTEVRKALSDLVLNINSYDGGIGTLIANLLSFPSKYGAGEFNFTSNSLGSCLDFADENKTRICLCAQPTTIPATYINAAPFGPFNYPFPFASVPNPTIAVIGSYQEQFVWKISEGYFSATQYGFYRGDVFSLKYAYGGAGTEITLYFIFVGARP